MQVELSIPLDEDGKPIDEIQEAHTIYETAVAHLSTAPCRLSWPHSRPAG